MSDIVAEKLDFVGRVVLLPITLLLNFSLFQYLVGLYFRRRYEPRPALLLLCAFASFVALIPFADPDDEVLHRLGDLSELASVLTFLVQITIIGRDVNKKIRMRSIKFATVFAELLSLLGVGLMFANIAEIAEHDSATASIVLNDSSDVFTNIALIFIVAFRFYYLSMSKGYKYIFKERKLELFFYTLFMTHECPFLALHSAYPNLRWDAPQALYSRTTISLCIGLTLRDRIRSARSRGATARTGASAHGAGSARSGASVRSSRTDSNAGMGMAEAINLARRKSSAFAANGILAAERLKHATANVSAVVALRKASFGTPISPTSKVKVTPIMPGMPGTKLR